MIKTDIIYTVMENPHTMIELMQAIHEPRHTIQKVVDELDKEKIVKTRRANGFNIVSIRIGFHVSQVLKRMLN